MHQWRLHLTAAFQAEWLVARGRLGKLQHPRPLEVDGVDQDQTRVSVQDARRDEFPDLLSRLAFDPLVHG